MGVCGCVGVCVFVCVGVWGCVCVCVDMCEYKCLSHTAVRAKGEP